MFNESTSSLNAGSFSLVEALEKVGLWLPTQGPIKDFIHHNTLHAFQDLPFHRALKSASRLHGAKPYLSLEQFQTLFHQGRIPQSAIDKVLALRKIPHPEWPAWQGRLLKKEPDGATAGIRAAGVRTTWCRTIGIDLDALVQPLLFRLLSGHLDQGISVWRMPHATLPFWQALRKIVDESWLPIKPLSDPLARTLLAKSPEAAALHCLSEIVGSESLFEEYLLAMFLSHPGWSGMIGMLEELPTSLLVPRKISLLELAAAELVLELGFVRRKLGADVPTVAAVVKGIEPANNTYPHSPLLPIWQEAFEWTLYGRVLADIEAHAQKSQTPDPASMTATMQAFFCIDDRECSLRRHLEEALPTIHTFSTAGFFGVDFMFQAADSPHRSQRCPIIIKPRHLVREKSKKTARRPRLKQLLHFHFRPETNTLFRGWLLTQVMGIWSMLRMAISVFRPSFRLLAEKALTRVSRPTEMELLRTSDEITPDGLLVGYSIEEMADRVIGVLQSAGLTENFSRLIVFVAHGATSANNPYFAAYDCGACSGRPGAPNARAFALMANNPVVRAEMLKRDLKLPPDCHFLGAIHDTTSDEVEYFDLENLPETHQSIFEEFDAAMAEALKRNAKERCRRFALVSENLSELAALKHVRERSVSIFEPRPEYNHATNAICVIGRRSLTRGLFLDRRAFLNSYEPRTDNDGMTLSQILKAVVPVCGGINLEYFFSRVDNQVYGAGSKLPHNVVALLGVANGIEGDLLTGLPAQMIEIHDPLRLLIIIEQEPDVVLKVVAGDSMLSQWFTGEWTRLAAFSPRERRAYFFSDGSFVKL